MVSPPEVYTAPPAHMNCAASLLVTRMPLPQLIMHSSGRGGTGVVTPWHPASVRLASVTIPHWNRPSGELK